MSENIESRRKIEEICNSFKESWSPETRPEFGDFLNQIEVRHQGELIITLLEIDLELRRDAGHVVNIEDYRHLDDDAFAFVKRICDTQIDQPEKTISFSEARLSRPAEKVDDEQQLGPYKLIKKIGEGGMGSVWVAQQFKPVKRRVALKLVKAGFGTKEVLARFDAERQALAMMNHPNIARILDAGTTPDGQPYFVMEYVEGVSITKYCDANRLNVDARLKLFIDVCAGVQHAHQKGVIHRDLKPGNIIVTTIDGKDVPKVIDFGLAKAMEGDQRLTEESLATSIGQILGTLKYMSPEQASFDGLDIDTRSDVYALGIILYELLTGFTPLDDESIKGAAILNVLKLIREKDVPRPSSRLSSTREVVESITNHRKTDRNSLNRILVGDLDWIVVKALEKDRERRYDSPSGFAADIQRFLDSEPVIARPPSASYRLRKFVRKNKTAVVASGFIAVSLLAGIIGTSIGLSRAVKAESDASQRAEGERMAKIAATSAKEDALRSAEKERQANQKAQRRLEQIEKGNEIMASVFAEIRIEKVRSEFEPLEAVLANRLLEAADQLDADAVGDPLLTADLQSKLGESLLNLGFPLDALRLFESAHQTFTDKLNHDDRKLIECKCNLARAHRSAGQFDLAMPLFQKALDLTVKLDGEDGANTLSVKSEIASVYVSQGEFDLGIELHSEVLKERRKKFGDRAASTRGSMNALAIAYQRKGRLDDAIRLYEESLRLDKELLAPEDPSLTTAMGNLAQCYQEAGKSDLALPLFNEVLSWRLKINGSQHPSTLTAMNNLAEAYRADKKYELAIEMFERVVKIREERLGSNHPDTLTAISNLSVCYGDVEKSQKSLSLAQKAVDFKKKTLGADHPSTLVSMNNLAQSYRRAGQMDLALPLLEETLKVTRMKLGDDHIQTLTALNNLAGGYFESNQPEKAAAKFKEAANLMEKKLGGDHPSTLVCLSNLGRCYRDAKDHDKAIEVLRVVYERKVTKLGAKNQSTLTSQSNLGKAYQVAGRLDQAISVFEECHAALKNISENSPLTLITGATLASCYCKKNRFEDALPFLEAAYPLAKQIPQLNWVQPDLLICYGKLGESRKLESTLKDVVAKARTRFADNEKALIDRLELFSAALLSVDAFGQADRLLDEVVLYRQEAQADNWRTFYAMAMHGAAKKGLKKFDEAKSLLQNALEGLNRRRESISGDSKSRLLQVVRWMIELAEANDDNAAIKKWTAEKTKLENEGN